MKLKHTLVKAMHSSDRSKEEPGKFGCNTHPPSLKNSIRDGMPIIAYYLIVNSFRVIIARLLPGVSKLSKNLLQVLFERV